MAIKTTVISHIFSLDNNINAVSSKLNINVDNYVKFLSGKAANQTTRGHHHGSTEQAHVITLRLHIFLSQTF